MASRPISVEDYVAITNMMAEYQHVVDSGDEDAYASYFTEDGAFHGLEGGPDLPGSVRGRDGLRQVARAVGSLGGMFRHFVGSFTVSHGESEDEAYARYYVLACNWRNEGADRLAMFTLVTTHLVRSGDRWLIKTQTMKNL